MTSDVLTVAERVDMIKLAKSVAIKSAAIIVQSRDGKTVLTKCNPNPTEHTLFNLAICEMVEVEREARRVIMSLSGSETRWSLCVDIVLRTVDGDSMTLETWNISLSSEFRDYINSYALYSRFGVIIKSLLAISRVVPAYRYSRRQTPDSYLIDYRIYEGEPKCSNLGEKFKPLVVGKVATPIGLWQMTVYYRTNMTISPQPSGIDTSMMVESNHFRPDFSPKHHRTDISEENSTSIGEEPGYKMGAFVESRRESLIPSDSDQLIPNVRFGSLLSAKASQQQSPTSAANETEICERLKAIDFVKDDANGNVTVTKSASSNNDFIVVDVVKPPFAESSGNVELGTFFSEWTAAPPLEACPGDQKIIDQVGDLTSQLATYETSLEEFDSVVTSLCEEPRDDSDENSPPLVF